jgi:nucleoside-diphosphate-sugar epimerase
MHLVIGAGPVGSATARALAERGERVRVVTRSGSGPVHPAIERVAADAADAPRLRELAAGASVLYNCVNPPYHRWPELWPPLAASMLAAAESVGAVLAITGNLYGYGPTDAPMTERTPLRPSSVKGGVRVRMWRDALAAHEAGRVRVVEARASDFIGVGGDSLLTTVVLSRVVRGRRAVVPAALDAPHSFTYVPDLARTLVALAADQRAWGRAWHVPSAPAVSVREAAAIACAGIGAPAPRLTRMPRAVLWAGGLANPLVRGFREMAYQFERPFVMDSSAATVTFGIEPTPLAEALRCTAEALRGADRQRVG